MSDAVLNTVRFREPYGYEQCGGDRCTDKGWRRRKKGDIRPTNTVRGIFGVDYRPCARLSYAQEGMLCADKWLNNILISRFMSFLLLADITSLLISCLIRCIGIRIPVAKADYRGVVCCMDAINRSLQGATRVTISPSKQGETNV